MFFRDKSSGKSKKPVLQLIESVRTEKGIRQRLVVSLGTRMNIPKEIRSDQLPTTAWPVINVRKAGIPEGIHAEVYKKLGMETDRLPVTQNFA